MGALQLRPSYSDLPTMEAEMNALAAQLENVQAGSANRLTRALFTRGHEGDLQKEVLKLEFVSDESGVHGLQLLGSANLTNLTPSKLAIVDTGGGGAGVNVVTAEDASDMSQGDVITLWDRSASSEIATGRRITELAVDDITFDGAPVTIGDGDELHKERVIELGEKRTFANGGRWIALSGVLAFVKPGGMYAEGETDGATLALLFGAGAGGVVVPKSCTYSAKCDFTQVGAGDGSAVGFAKIGQLDATPFIFGQAINRSLGSWFHGSILSDQPTPDPFPSRAETDPNGLTDILVSSSLILGPTPTSITMGQAMSGAGLTAIFGQAIDELSLVTASWTPGQGPDEGLALIASAVGGGTLSILAKEVSARWVVL